MASKTKVCPRCKQEKDREIGYTNYTCKKSGRRITKSWCMVCTSERQRSQYKNNPDFRERANARHREYKKDPEYRTKYNVWRNKWRRGTIDNLADSYVKERLKRAGKDVTPESIEEARTKLLMHRIKKKLRDGEG